MACGVIRASGETTTRPPPLRLFLLWLCVCVHVAGLGSRKRNLSTHSSCTFGIVGLQEIYFCFILFLLTKQSWGRHNCKPAVSLCCTGCVIYPYIFHSTFLRWRSYCTGPFPKGTHFGARHHGISFPHKMVALTSPWKSKYHSLHIEPNTFDSGVIIVLWDQEMAFTG